MTRFHAAIVFLLVFPAAPVVLAQAAPRVWYVDSSAAYAGDGNAASPLKTLRAAIEASAAGDVILLAPSAAPYAGGVTLKDRQTLAGAGAEAVAVLQRVGVAVPATLATATPPVITGDAGDAITLAGDDTIAGVTFRSARHAAIAGGPAGATMLAGITIDGGQSGVVLRAASGKVTILRSMIRDTAGSGVVVENGRDVTLSGLVLTHDAAKNGVGAITCAGDLVNGSTSGCSAAIDLRDTTGVTMTDIVVDGSAQIGINGEGVTDLTMTNVEVKGAGDEAFESGVQFRNVAGDIVLTKCRFHDNGTRQLYIENGKGDLRLTIDASSFGSGARGTSQQGMLIGLHDAAVARVDIRGSSFTNNVSNGLHVITVGRARLTLAIEHAVVDHNAGGIILVAGGDSAIDYRIAGSELTASTLGAINVAAAGPGAPSVSGTITGNTVGKSGVPGSGAVCGECHGLALDSRGAAHFRAVVTGNVIQQVDGPGIRAIAAGSSNMQLTIAGNTVREPMSGSGSEAIRLQAGASKNDTASLCADVGGAGPKANTISGKWGGEAPIVLRNRFAGTKITLAGYNGDGKNLVAIANYLAARNGGAVARPLLGTGDVVNSFGGATQCEPLE